MVEVAFRAMVSRGQNLGRRTRSQTTQNRPEESTASKPHVETTNIGAPMSEGKLAELREPMTEREFFDGIWKLVGTTPTTPENLPYEQIIAILGCVIREIAIRLYDEKKKTTPK